MAGTQQMQAEPEIIALLLADASDERWHAGEFGQGAQCLIRHADGQVRLEAITSPEQFERVARRSGCFRRGSPIRDPQTREIIGYEMEEVPLLRAAAGL